MKNNIFKLMKKWENLKEKTVGKKRSEDILGKKESKK